MIKYKNKVSKLLLLVFVLLTIKSVGKTALLPDYKLIVSTVEDISGNVMACNVYLKNTVNGQIIKGKYTNETTVFNLKKGDNYKLIAESEGYYSEEKDILSRNFENQEDYEITVRLTSRPFAKIQVKLADLKIINDAKFDLVFNNLNFKSFTLNSKKAQEDIVVYESGEYLIQGALEGYKKYSESLEIIVANPPVNVQKFVNFEKQETSGEWKLINKITNKIIKENGSFDLVDIQTSKVVKKGLIKDGILAIEFPDTKTYKLKVSQKGYSVYFDNISILNIGRELFLVEQSNVLLLLKDKLTKELLDGQLTITGPNQKVLNLKSNTIFNPEMVGNYTIKSIKEGYSEKNGTLIIETLKGGNIEFILELEKKIDDFVITPIDAETKIAVKNFKIKLFDENGKNVSTINNQDDKKLNVEYGKKYFYEITADGYNDFTSNLGNEKIIQVPLKKIKSKINFFDVVDNLTKEQLTNVKFRIINENKELVALKKNPETKRFEAELKPEIQYSLEVSADGYQPYTSYLNKSEKREHIISLSPVSLEKFTFEAIDEYTNLPIAANFICTLNGKKIELNSSLEDPLKKVAMLNKTYKYEIVASFEDYGTVKKEVTILGLDNDKVFKVYLNKNQYKILFNVKNQISKSEFEKLNINLTNASGKKTPIKISQEGNSFEVVFTKTENYKLSISSTKFEKYVSELNLQSLIETKLIKEIELIEIAKPLAEKPKPVEEQKPKLIEAKTEEKPVLVEKKPEKKKTEFEYSKDVNTFPISKDEVLSVFSNEVLGKRYVLGKVEFPQSSPIFTESSKDQLNILADMMLKYNTYKLQLTGYTDNVGNSKINLYLSEFRAKSISNYLYNKGIAADRIITFGKGNDGPIAPNDTDENKAKNRRVEMVIIEN